MALLLYRGETTGRGGKKSLSRTQTPPLPDIVRRVQNIYRWEKKERKGLFFTRMSVGRGEFKQ